MYDLGSKLPLLAGSAWILLLRHLDVYGSSGGQRSSIMASGRNNFVPGWVGIPVESQGPRV